MNKKLSIHSNDSIMIDKNLQDIKFEIDTIFIGIKLFFWRNGEDNFQKTIKIGIFFKTSKNNQLQDRVL